MSEKDFIVLINDNKKLIHKACTTYCNNHNREDLIQEITIQIWRSLDSFKKGCKFSTWIFEIAKNVCVDVLRKQKNKPSIIGLDDYEDVLIDNDYSEELIEQLHTSMRYNTIMDSISEPYKKVFEMHLYGSSYEDISKETGIPENTLRVNVCRINKRLRLRYGGYKTLKNVMP
jgi:RNA polymerase sigma-70 factor, ECF subfamily